MIEEKINQATTKFLSDLEMLRSAGKFKRDKEIADLLEMGAGNFSQVLNGKRNIPKDKAEKFYSHFEKFVFTKKDDKNYSLEEIVKSKNEVIATLQEHIEVLKELLDVYRGKFKKIA